MHRFRAFSLFAVVLAAALAAPATATAQQIPLDALMRGGRIHYMGDRYANALDQFNKALAQYGATADNATLSRIHVWIGLSQAQLKQLDSAAAHFALAIEKDTTAADKIRKDEQWQYWAWTALISATRDRYNSADYEPALRYALDAVKVDPSKPQTYALVANIYSALGRYEDMLATARNMLNMNSRSAEAFGLLGLYFLQKPDSLWPTPQAKFARWDSAAYYYDRAINVYSTRFDSARAELKQVLKVSDNARLEQIAWRLIEKSRLQDQAELKRYIEDDLGAARQLADVAQAAARLFYAANNLNAASSRAGSAMLRASASTHADTSERFRARAESLFSVAVTYDSTDMSALFDLGITQYQGRKDSLAERTLGRVVEEAVAPVAMLPAPWRDSLLAVVTPGAAGNGFVELEGSLARSVDSVLFGLGRKGGDYSWLYCLDLKGKTVSGHATVADTAGMFLSTQMPSLLDQTFLWLGSSQTGRGNALLDGGHKAEAADKFTQAIVNLTQALKIVPDNADAYQNLGVCYRETGQKDKALQAFTTADKLRGHQ